MTANITPQKIRYRVQGTDCASCAREIETALTRMPGVSEIAISTTTETLRLRVDGDSTGEQVEEVVRDLGYGITPVTKETRHHHGDEAEDAPWWKSPKGRLRSSADWHSPPRGVWPATRLGSTPPPWPSG